MSVKLTALSFPISSEFGTISNSQQTHSELETHSKTYCEIHAFNQHAKLTAKLTALPKLTPNSDSPSLVECVPGWYLQRWSRDIQQTLGLMFYDSLVVTKVFQALRTSSSQFTT